MHIVVLLSCTVFSQMSRFREDQNIIPASGTKILLFTVIDGHPAEVQLSM